MFNLREEIDELGSDDFESVKSMITNIEKSIQQQCLRIQDLLIDNINQDMSIIVAAAVKLKYLSKVSIRT